MTGSGNTVFTRFARTSGPMHSPARVEQISAASGVRGVAKSSISPTQRSLALLRAEGYTVEVVEKWNAHARIRQDLFGFIDILGVRDGETLAVQTTAGSCLASRRKKIAEHENLGAVRKAGWRIELHGWRKLKAGWQCKREDVS
jgi:hypothetical protein